MNPTALIAPIGWSYARSAAKPLGLDRLCFSDAIANATPEQMRVIADALDGNPECSARDAQRLLSAAADGVVASLVDIGLPGHPDVRWVIPRPSAADQIPPEVTR